jgi:hypothetical protein
MFSLIAYKQYGHNKCALFTLPHPEHLFSDVMSFNPLPAKNRWRFFRYDVFFFGTARSTDSQMSDIEGRDGRAGRAIEANASGNIRKGAWSLWRSGRLRTGRMGDWREGKSAGRSAGRSDGRGRAAAMVVERRRSKFGNN